MERTANVISSRGCPFSCIFCESELTMGKRVRRRSVQNVIDEIIQLQKKYHIKAVFFVDDIFASNKKWLMEFCNQIQQKKIFLHWGCQSRADSLDEETIASMAKAGCLQIDMGIESGDPKILKALKKGECIEDFIRTADLIHKYHIRLLCSFLTGAPEETWESIEKTKRLIKRLKPSMCQYFTLVPYPGSPLYDLALKNNWLQNLSFSSKGSQKQWDQGFLTCGLGSKDQIKAKKQLQRLTMTKDYLHLVVGWVKYPGYIFTFMILTIKNMFFVKPLFYSITRRNPLFFLHEVYSAFNKFFLFKIRKNNV